MRGDLDFLSIMRWHFPVFICTFFLALFAMAATQFMLLQQYPPAQEDLAEYLMGASGGVSLYLCLANLIVVRGRPWGVWPIVVAMLACILTVLLHWGERRVPGSLSVIGLLLPLLALLMLNSKRHREFRKVMVEVRWKRAAWRKKHKQ
ncbi:hypothetical protein NJC40_26790 [Pseudomonas sp. 21LCFQ02]|uniref:hypothetical protein n=1 Tax=Pseudomonas sp. 21LCFQ02 TaxID=2957505 RepID=UPI00209A8915|nr:hypothetical protein [Pseudomonas sp. 21LCFQ02]